MAPFLLALLITGALEDARRLVEGCVEHDNNVRLHSAAGYITLKDMLAGLQQEIHAELSTRSHPGGSCDKIAV